MTDEAIARLLECDARRPNPEPLIVVRTLRGALARVAADASAYPHRSARFNLSVDGCWFDPALDEAAIGWARSTWAATRPYSNGGVYINFSGTADEAERSRGALLGANQQRLEEVRLRYDPDGLFAAAARRP